jgi:hypothetical protein
MAEREQIGAGAGCAQTWPGRMDRARDRLGFRGRLEGNVVLFGADAGLLEVGGVGGDV